jgi:para-aminobenzoate synthetase / 4-amino-4-deoxychorismate lyase
MMLLDADLPRLMTGKPFVLVDDARPGGGAKLFAAPVEIVRADRSDGVEAALGRVEAGLARGLTAAGYLGYGAAAAFEAGWPREGASDWPVLWFGLFERALEIDVAAGLPEAAAATLGALRPRVSVGAYRTALERVLALIAAGDIYQANLTFRAEIEWAGEPWGIYARMRERSRAGHGGVVDLGDRALLSASPELFFELADGRVRARPMKGTAPRSGDPQVDAERAAGLLASDKERAENLMITDLLRNDLSRVAEPGSVVTPALFSIEAYPTVLQMTSTVEARLRAGLGPVDVLRAAFPCGSVTGAPKLRAAEIIAEVEADGRGPYTGSIGWMTQDAACFNVVIRTLQLTAQGPAIIGLGSGIVADSRADSEWAECLAKAAFLTGTDAPA